MTRFTIHNRLAGLIAGAVLLTLAGPACAEWRRAESERFVVYSQENENALRQQVRKLEVFDRMLRTYMRLPTGQVPVRKLPIYMVRNHQGLEIVWPNVPEQIAGFYAASEEDIYAIAMRQSGGEQTLLHEYAHHFMYQNFTSTYPGWFIEGFAEYYATSDIDEPRIDVGKPDENRSYWLVNGQWLPLEDLLGKQPGEISRRQETYYPLAWLLTHWFLSDTERRQQLADYLDAINRGSDPVLAMQDATGLDIDQLTRALRMYTRQSLTYRRLTLPVAETPVTVTTLPRAADDLLLLRQRLMRYIDDDDKPALIAEVRRLAARHSGDALAQTVLARAEIVAGDPQAAEPILAALLERDPANVEALQLMARTLMVRADAEADIDAAENTQRRARSFLGRAFGVDDANFTTFLMLAESRRTAPDYPTDNDIATLRLAATVAPQLPSIRLNLAAALIYRGSASQTEIANLLQPVANDPHDSGLAAAAQSMIDRAGQSGSRQVLDAAEAAEGLPPPEPETPTVGVD